MATDYTYQIAFIVPDAEVAAARRIAEAMGWGPGNYSCELTDGTNTFWGLSSVATAEFAEMMMADPYAVTLGEEEDPFAFSDDLDAVLPVLLQSMELTGTRTQAAQFDALCTANGLIRVTNEAS